MDIIYINEWIEKNEEFLNTTTKTKLNKKQIIYRIWYGIASTKYLNSNLIREFNRIAITSQLSIYSVTNIIKRFSQNHMLTIDIIKDFPYLNWNILEISS